MCTSLIPEDVQTVKSALVLRTRAEVREGDKSPCEQLKVDSRQVKGQQVIEKGVPVCVCVWSNGWLRHLKVWHIYLLLSRRPVRQSAPTWSPSLSPAPSRQLAGSRRSQALRGRRLYAPTPASLKKNETQGQILDSKTFFSYLWHFCRLKSETFRSSCWSFLLPQQLLRHLDHRGQF